MQIRIFFYAALFVLITCPGAGASDTIKLHYPPDRTVIEYDILNISLSIPEGSADLIRATIDGTDAKEIVPDAEFECFSVKLKPGTNTVEVTVLKGETVAASFVRSVFRRSDLVSEYRKPPHSFNKSRFHMEDHTECKKCHVLETGEFDKKTISPGAFSPAGPGSEKVFAETSTCYSCHNNMTKYPFIHGPASVWSCLDCHDQNAADKYSVRQPVKEVCYECHIEQKKERDLKKYIHGPVNTGQCTICHNPHASGYPFNLYKSTWELCVSCHAEKGTGLHVLGSAMFKEGHPTKGRKDPVRAGKELTCASCHDPHASNYPHLWAFEVDDVFELCKKCHFDK